MKQTLSIIIPTFNNPEFLNPCVQSILSTGTLHGTSELVIVNNGKQPIKEMVKDYPNTRVLEPGKNLGWEGGLQYGLENSDSEYVCFQNDDTLIPKATQTFYQQLLWPFQNKKVGAVGPATTIASGWHSIMQRYPVRTLMEVPYLIFFTVMLRRADLEAAGGIDVTAPGGDDLDLSIRLRKMGKTLLINPDAFLIHHAFKTGERVRGDRDKPNGWNSKEMIDRTNQWLIQKHGFKTFLQTMRGFDYDALVPPADSEGEAVLSLVQGAKVVELGCGFRKTVPDSIGIDKSANGEHCANLDGPGCVADISADVTEPLPIVERSVDTVIARHILEHCTDTVGTLRHWNKILKVSGRLIIAVPNQELRNTIPLNPEHVHAFTPKSLKHVLELCGFKQITVLDPGNGISFVACFEKVLHLAEEENGRVMEMANA